MGSYSLQMFRKRKFTAVSTLLFFHLKLKENIFIPVLPLPSFSFGERQTDRQTDRDKYIETDRQPARQTDRDRETETEI